MSGPSHEEKQFEKLMAQEAKADEKLITMAAKEMKRAEKAYNKSVKESEKAEKAMAKLAKALTKTSKHQNAMEHKHKDAIVSREKAEKTLTDKTQTQSLESQDVEQRQKQLFEAHETININKRERIRSVSAFRAEHGEDNTPLNQQSPVV